MSAKMTEKSEVPMFHGSVHINDALCDNYDINISLKYNWYDKDLQIAMKYFSWIIYLGTWFAYSL